MVDQESEVEFDVKNNDIVPPPPPKVVTKEEAPKPDVEIDVVDDTPVEDRNRPKLPADRAPKIPSDDEIEEYSESVQKRIKQVKFEYHEERRRRETAEREHAAAIDYARRVAQEHAALSHRYAEGEVILKDQAQKKLEFALESARSKYKAAYEAGDLKGLAEVQEDMARLNAEKIQVDSYRPQPARPTVPPMPHIPRPDHKAEEWASNNPWFMRDSRMTNVVMQYQDRIQREEGVNPTSDEYYQKIDKYMRQAFPTSFEGERVNGAVEGQRQPPATVVAPATRSPATKSPRKITLTASQVSMCQKIGITPEQYARQLLKEHNG